MARDLLYEIGCEDLPPLQVGTALDQLAEAFLARAAALRIEHGTVHRYATPCRLALVVQAVSERQLDLEQTKVGPPSSVGFDADGNPTRALLGFMRGIGLEPDQADQLLRVVQEKKKGKPAEYVAAVVTEKGRPVAELLPALLSELPGILHWPKSMRWGDCPQAFARPVHWLLARFGEDVVPCGFADVESGGTTRGHRFMSSGDVEVRTAGQYVETLCAHKVLVDPAQRRARVLEAAHEAAAQVGGTLKVNDALLDEVTQLVEWPVPIVGTFEEEFLALPSEVLVTTMRKHQRYFSLVDDDGAMLPNFVTIANTEVRDPAVVARGNHRVLRARLKDAEFFFREDQKRSLDAWAESLGRVTYVEGLGSVKDKVARIRRVGAWLAATLYPGDDELAASVDRAAALCKADLATNMVYEFAELQGFVGGEYARNSGESGAVADAIAEHYAPRGASDDLPATAVGAVVSIADRIDSIASLFALGRVPTGAADPFALRRAALGIIRIAIAGDLRFAPLQLAEAACAAVGETIAALGDASTISLDEALPGRILEFVLTRLRHVAAENHPREVVDAVLALGAGLEDLSAAVARIEALSAMRATPDFEPIAITFKRAGNILGDGTPAAVDPERFEEAAESALFDATGTASIEFSEHLSARRFREALDTLVNLRSPVDTFFEAVLVNAEDADIRQNRHGLLRDVLTLFRRYADVRRL